MQLITCNWQVRVDLHRQSPLIALYNASTSKGHDGASTLESLPVPADSLMN